MEYGTRDGGMEFGTGPAHHQDHAMSSHHMESEIVIVVYVMSGMIIQLDGKVSDHRS